MKKILGVMLSLTLLGMSVINGDQEKSKKQYHYTLAHLPQSKGIAIVEVDAQHGFSSREDAINYNTIETRKLLQAKYPGMTDQELDRIVKNPSRAQEVLNDHIKTLASAKNIKPVLYSHGLPVDGADAQFFAKGQQFLEWGRSRGLVIVRTADWHPKDSVTFASTHDVPAFTTKVIAGEGSLPNGTRALLKKEQVVWPDHCIANTRGAEFVNRSPRNWLANILYIRRWVQRADIIQRKGQKNESYSGAIDTYGNDLGLIEKLEKHGIEGVLIAGLAGGHCVDNTALDLAKKGGIKVGFLVDLTRWLAGRSEVDVPYRELLVNNIRDMHAAGIQFYSVKSMADEKHSKFVNGLFKEANVPVESVDDIDAAHAKLVDYIETTKTTVAYAQVVRNNKQIK